MRKAPFDMKTKSPRQIALECLVKYERGGSSGGLTAAYGNFLSQALNDNDLLPRRDKAFIKSLVLGVLKLLPYLDELISRNSLKPNSRLKPVIRCILRMGIYQILETNVPARAAIDESVELAKENGFAGLAGFINAVLRNVSATDLSRETVQKPIGMGKADCPKTSNSEHSSEVSAALDDFVCPSAYIYRRVDGFSDSLKDIYEQPDSLCTRNICLPSMFDDRSSRTVCRKGRPKDASGQLPQWLAEMLTAQYGMEVCERYACAILEPSPICLRPVPALCANPRKIGQWLTDCADALVEMIPHPYSENMFVLKRFEKITKIPGYQEGLFFIQDFSSYLAVLCAGIKAGDLVADVCAAPGGKAIFAAALCSPGGHVYAFDKTQAKIKRLSENAVRMKIGNITCAVADASGPDFSRRQTFDAVICDLPCSGLGVVAKKPDILRNMNPEKIASLITLQRNILARAQSLVKPGGSLLYSTCTINKDENIGNANWFLGKFSSFAFCGIDSYLPKELCCESSQKGWLTTLPGTHKCDGAFMARFVRSRL